MRVLAVGGQPLFRDAVARAISARPELELVGEAGDGRAALAAIGAEQPDVAVIDGTPVGLTREQLLRAVSRDGLGTRVVLMAERPLPGEVYAALVDGAAGYLTKDADARELCDAITAVARGRTVLAPELQAGVAAEIRLRAAHERPLMSARERETLELTAEGLSARRSAASCTSAPPP